MFCELNNRLSDLIKFVCEIELTADQKIKLEELIEGHDLARETPIWMLELITNISNGTECENNVPSGYPRGENGLCNLLGDLVEEMSIPLGFVDYGEAIEWDVPVVNVHFFLSRETVSNGFYKYRIGKKPG